MPKPTMGAALLALLAGCSYPHGPGSTNLVDGSYQGRPRLQAVDRALCPSPHYGVLEIGDRELHFAYLPTIVFDAPVQPDGTLHDEQGPSVLDGRIHANRLQLSVTTPDCHTDYNTAFIWNHS